MGSYPGHLSQVCNLGKLSEAERMQALAATEVSNIWGVARKIGARPVEGGVRSVLELVCCDVATLRNQFSVVLEKTVLELRGTSCLSMDEALAAKQQILVSRSFRKAVTEVAGIVEAVSEFASRAAESLRLQDGAAGAIDVFFTTSPFRPTDQQHSPCVTVPLVRHPERVHTEVGIHR